MNQFSTLQSFIIRILVLPAAMLQGLYYNEKRPQYMNFGTLGTMAAVELIKGFTQEGSKYDKFGHLARLWTNAARRNFNQNTDCLMREASLFDIENTDIKVRKILNWFLDN